MARVVAMIQHIVYHILARLLFLCVLHPTGDNIIQNCGKKMRLRFLWRRAFVPRWAQIQDNDPISIHNANTFSAEANILLFIFAIQSHNPYTIQWLYSRYTQTLQLIINISTPYSSTAITFTPVFPVPLRTTNPRQSWSWYADDMQL